MPCHISFRALAYEPGVDTVIITMITDIASHVFIRVSDNPSRIHTKSVKRRGTDFMSELRFCFTVYEDIEQLEPGDTTTHTFIVPDWPYCTTKYFYFWGSVDGVTCVSTSPPFHYHNSYTYIPPVLTSDKYTLSWAGSHIAQGWNAHSERFTPDHDYTARRISLVTCQYDANRRGPYVVKLTTVGGNCWEEEILWSQEGYSTDLPFLGDETWQDYEPVDIPLTADVQYRIVIHTIPDWYYWFSPNWLLYNSQAALRSRWGMVAPLYPRGVRFYGCNISGGSGSWTQSSGTDLCFKVWE